MLTVTERWPEHIARRGMTNGIQQQWNGVQEVVTEMKSGRRHRHSRTEGSRSG